MASLTNYFSKVFDSFDGSNTRKLNRKIDYKLTSDADAGHPNKAWKKRLKQKVKREALTPIDPDTPISKENLRFVCISDTHTKLEQSKALKIPDGDVLLHAGDFSMQGAPEEVHLVNKYLGTLPHKQKVVIAGNHDNSFDLELLKKRRKTSIWSLTEENYEKCLKKYGVKTVHDLLTNCIYLQDSAVEVCGIKIFGSPWTPGHGSWGFQRPRGQGLMKKWNDIPNDTDILLTHCPPCGYGDDVEASTVGKALKMLAGVQEDHVGCVDLLNTVQTRVRPKYHVYGHIHEGYGIKTDGKTVFINASTCTRLYLPDNPPIVFDFPIPEGYSKVSLDNIHAVSNNRNDSDYKHSRSDSCDDDDDDVLGADNQYNKHIDEDFFHLDRECVDVTDTNFARLNRFSDRDEKDDGGDDNSDSLVFD